MSLGVGLATILLAACGSYGRVDTAASVAAQVAGQANAVAAAAPAAAPGAVSQGIQVHGWWSIDVRDQDGTLRSHIEFANALWAGQGDLALASFLG